MPELPEVEITARLLDGALKGAAIAAQGVSTRSCGSPASLWPAVAPDPNGLHVIGSVNRLSWTAGRPIVNEASRAAHLTAAAGSRPSSSSSRGTLVYS